MLLPTLLAAAFLKRLNRFAALVDLDGSHVTAHVPNSGRLEELLTPGVTVYLAQAGDRARPEVSLPWPAPRGSSVEERRTKYDLVLVDLGGLLVSCDARLPPDLFAEGLTQGRIDGLQKYQASRREPALGDGRADLLLATESGDPIVVETKSVTLVEEGVGLFPDAPTERGARHARSLASLVVEQGQRALIAFVVQREDIEALKPNDDADPLFGQSLRTAVRAGVEAMAFKCEVTLEHVRITSSVPVLL